MKYRVVLVPSENGYAVSCPALPGCWSQGANEEEALANIRDAMRDYVEVQAELLAREACAAGTPALVRQVELAGA
ncbi:MAG: type II toxin-antitoxin system HicB family antitoxin [Verrucomicrobia bacterium]|nr:type II toxin-antitoxin system HicB family antitoxin [Verrucomicrobiota bacterium]